MADVFCAKCNEPWDRYGIEHGDVTPGEAMMILQGRGCPCCEGVASEDGDEMEALRSTADSWDGCPIEAINRMADNSHKPYDTAIPPIILHTCEGCGIQEGHDPEDYIYNEWQRLVKGKGKAKEPSAFNVKGSRWQSWEVDQLSFETINDATVCSRCCNTCDHCGEQFVDGADDTFHRQVGMNIEHFCSAECYCARVDEEQSEWVVEEGPRLLQSKDVEIVGGWDDWGTLAFDLDWTTGDDPSPDDVLQWFIDNAPAVIRHDVYGGPYTSEQWGELFALDLDVETLATLEYAGHNDQGSQYDAIGGSVRCGPMPESEAIQLVTAYNSVILQRLIDKG